MGTWVFPIALSLLYLTPGSLQGGLPQLPPNLGKAFGDAKPQKPGPPAQNGYGTGVGGGMEPPKPVFSNANGLEAGTGQDIASSPGFGGIVKPQKSGYGPGLGAGVFPGVGPQLGIRGGMKPPKPEFGAGAFPGVGAQPGFGNGNSLGAQPGFGGVGKPQKPVSPGLGNGNGLEAGTFPGTGAQPGLGEGMRPQKPGLTAQNGHGPGIQRGMKPPKPGLGNGNGLDTLPGPATQNGYGQDYGVETKPQKPGFRNGHGLGIQLAPTLAMQWGLKPQKAGYQPSNGYGAEAEQGFRGLKLQKVGDPEVKTGAKSQLGNGYRGLKVCVHVRLMWQALLPAKLFHQPFETGYYEAQLRSQGSGNQVDGRPLQPLRSGIRKTALTLGNLESPGPVSKKIN
ncbi:hypothetical protein STEG23_000195 [Scotinomys teguina]